MNERRVQLLPGHAIVIAGPAGSGKTTLARTIAQTAGRFVETTAERLLQSFGLGVLYDEPDVCIVDEVRASELEKFNTWISSTAISVERKHCEAFNVKSPVFILCMQSSIEYARLEMGDRHFLIVLGK